MRQAWATAELRGPRLCADATAIPVCRNETLRVASHIISELDQLQVDRREVPAMQGGHGPRS